MLPPVYVMRAVYMDDGQDGDDDVTSAASGRGGNTTVTPEPALGLPSSGVVMEYLPGMLNKLFGVREDAD